MCQSLDLFKVYRKLSVKILHLVWLPFVSSAVSVTTDLYQNISDYWQLLHKLTSRFRSIFDARLRIKPYRVMASVLADYTAHEVFNVHQFAFLRIQLYRHYNSLFCECQYYNSLFSECFCLQRSILGVK